MLSLLFIKINYIRDMDNLASRVRNAISVVILTSSMFLLVVENRNRRNKFTIIVATDRNAYLCPKNDKEKK